ncbi:MAG: AMP-binding protein, partial [Thiohalophilus sp.]
MSDDKIYDVPADFAKQANISENDYETMYRRSIDDPEGFWAEQAEKFLTWYKPWNKVLDWSYDADDLHIKWFEGGKLNVAYNCIDRHLDERSDQTAIIWEGDDPGDDKHITYRELHEQVSRLGNVLKERGVKKGDRVCIYMPMIPEAGYAMLACARIGAVHSVVFGGFSPESLKDRILDSDCQVVITSDEGVRGGKHVPLKANTDKALEGCPNVHTVLTVKRTGGNIEWHDKRDVWYHEAIDK